jgi:hypothetical protein
MAHGNRRRARFPRRVNRPPAELDHQWRRRSLQLGARARRRRPGRRGPRAWRSPPRPSSCTTTPAPAIAAARVRELAAGVQVGEGLGGPRAPRPGRRGPRARRASSPPASRSTRTSSSDDRRRGRRGRARAPRRWRCRGSGRAAGVRVGEDLDLGRSEHQGERGPP